MPQGFKMKKAPLFKWKKERKKHAELMGKNSGRRQSN
jgi:hypothetical protein